MRIIAECVVAESYRLIGGYSRSPSGSLHGGFELQQWPWGGARPMGNPSSQSGPCMHDCARQALSHGLVNPMRLGTLTMGCAQCRPRQRSTHELHCQSCTTPAQSESSQSYRHSLCNASTPTLPVRRRRRKRAPREHGSRKLSLTDSSFVQ
jgi:hypothetical protein